MPGVGDPAPKPGDGVSCGFPAGGGRLSRRIHSTVTPKKSASCDRRISSGVRIPLSHGLHCCGETPNASAPRFPPPRPGNFFNRHSRIFRAMISRSSFGILPMMFNPFLGQCRLFHGNRKRAASCRKVQALDKPMQARPTTAQRQGFSHTPNACMSSHTKRGNCLGSHLIVCIADYSNIFISSSLPVRKRPHHRETRTSACSS